MVDTNPPPTNSADPASDLYDQNQLTLPPNALQTLIYEHLVHNCYSETARAFNASCRIDSHFGPDEKRLELDDDGDVEMSEGVTAAQTLEPRKRVWEMIVKGQIPEAIEFCNDAFPGVLDGTTKESVDILFELQCQRFVECVRQRCAVDALAFAQEELGKFIFHGPQYLTALNRIIALIAYADPETSPVAEFLSQKRREEVATMLNSYILSYHSLPPTTTMERIVRQATVVREALGEAPKDGKKSGKPQHPKWQLSILVGEAGV
ncbi:uncharacterized protein SPPG_01359 [Spizellomyces punctatus DAOM BR117]|uniref:CTLH domain-containing protein n=1 Tax=Spizellomyces punctatus (strain DAOM BR117) TaxID=645134 RepID=A0A0L0HS46_SPIPD|nr:uncharacterized protein SPPG_01359 [Spizellomyces punctatus DAOM BR117]KND03907.1 hypothetical protein SPPG_01359 [Spizellomyces punctatus DAOM BR117]|eukprot:XP_016611946.1 hypothetical protein SPPG_01359 [Spizellomyces punctatus DAOM BR117]